MVGQPDIATALEFLKSAGLPFDPMSLKQAEDERPGRQMPGTIYDKAPDFTLIEHIEELLSVQTGVDKDGEPILDKTLFEVLEKEAQNRGLNALTLLRNELGIAMLDGNFELALPEKIADKDKRTGADNNPKDPAVMRLKAILRQPTANMFIAIASNFKLSNASALRLFVSKIFEADEAIKRIREAQQAQLDEDELKRMKPAEWFQRMTRR